MPMLVADAVDAERVIFIPANLNPQKDDEPPTEAHHRLAMLEAAIAHDPRARISKIELDRPPPSYSIDTVKAVW